MVGKEAGTWRISPGTLGADGIVRLAGGANCGPGKRQNRGAGLHQRGVPTAGERSGHGAHQYTWRCPFQRRKRAARHLGCGGRAMDKVVGTVPLGNLTSQTRACRLALFLPGRGGITGRMEKDCWRLGLRRVQVACIA